MSRERGMDKKTVIITGAASGIGKAAAMVFARQGALLVLADIDEKQLARVKNLVIDKKGRAVCQKTDVSDENQIKSLVDLAVSTYGQVDVLCNNAGITGDFSGLDTEDLKNWQTVLNVNLIGAVLATKHVSQIMMKKNSGAIVNTSSVAGIRAGAGSNAYSASKAALINYTKTAACDLGAFNIRVNAVCPGLIKTGMTKPVFDYAKQAGKEAKLGNRCELKRYGLPSEVANAILFLASDEASYITGQALAVDGGNTASLNMPGMKF